ncbi:MAG: copper amine oxidase N-terminal domain-containing protein, partial [Moorella sp. (in: Bacteria)]|nr:copper amine oxidase N-terminal domain-containing protein [Moorella sp. (in: firmicutes)]
TAVQLTIGSNVLKVNGISLTMDVAPEIVNGRTMLPARFVAQALGASVGYDDANQTVTIEM